MDMSNLRIHPDYIAAFLMILIIARGIYTGFDLLEGAVKYFSISQLEPFIDLFLSLIAVIVLLSTRHRSIVKTLIVSSLLFAILCLIDGVNDIMRYGEVLDYDLENFITGVLMLAFGTMLLGNILIYWSKASASLDAMLFSMAGILCLNIVQDLTLFRYGSELGAIAENEFWNIPEYALMVFNILLLRSDSVKVHTLLYRIRDSSDEIKKASVPTGVRIDRMQIMELKAIAESGLSEGSYEIDLNSFYPIDYKIILTKNGDGTAVRFCSIDDNTGTGIARFNLRGVWTDTDDVMTCDLVRIYGDDMFFIQLIAGGPYRKSSEKVSLKEIFRG